MWPWSRIRELTQMIQEERDLMLQAERALRARLDQLDQECAVLREQRDAYGQNWLHAARKNSDFRDALSKIKGMRTPGANGTVVLMAKVAEDALR